MFQQHLLFQAPSVSPWATGAVGRLPSLGDPALEEGRDAWMAAFVERLAELRPNEDEDLLAALAADLWGELGGHDPVMAAEMEHEASPGTD